MSSTQEFNESQLAAARAKKWHQDGDALLTMEAAREWLNANGLVLFAPRPQIAAPAPSLVEATLGTANAAPKLGETETARGLVGRMVADGVAVPLNLLGAPGDAPDFVVSAQVFSYVFTLRGDKAWKQPPVSTNVSPLALKVYEALASKGATSAMDLAGELGRELTEAAIARSLGELWTQLRVIPLLQQGAGATQWELTSKRFTKAIKAGANAGVPTALSALVSLYLAQAIAATEDEIETFLSPLTARSRVREVVHALTAARQLETVVLEGKTLVHVPGALPEFGPIAVAAAEEGVEAPVAVEKPKKVGTGRIAKFSPESRGADEFRGKPVKKFGAGKPAAGKFGKGPGMVKPSARFGARADGKNDRERRPFKKDAKSSFSKPWEEDRKRPAAAGTTGAAAPAFKKFRKPAAEGRRVLGDREQAGLPAEKRVFSKPKFERESFARDAAKKNAGASEGGEGAAWKKPRSFGSSDGAAKSGGFGAKRPYAPRSAEGGAGGFAKRPYKPRDAERGERPAFKARSYEKKPGAFAAKRPFTPRAAEGGATGFAKRAHTSRTTEGAAGFAKRPYKPRDAEGGAARGEFKPRSYEKKPGGFAAKRPYTPRASEGGEGTFAKRPYKPREAEGGADRGDFKPRSFAKKPGGFAGKPRFGGSKSGGGFSARRGFTPVDDNAARTLPKKPYKPRAADADQRKFTKAPWTPSEESAAPRKSFGGKPKGSFGGKKFGGGFKGNGGFGAKRAGGARPVARKPRAEE